MGKVHAFIRRRELLSFFILTFTISWAVWIAAPFICKDSGVQKLMNLAGVFGPSLAAMTVARMTSPQKRKPPGIRYWLIFAGCFIISFIIGLLSLNAFFNIPFSFTACILIGILSLLASFTIAGSFSANTGVAGLMKPLLRFKTSIKWYFATLLLLPLIHLVSGFIDMALSGQFDIMLYYREPLQYLPKAFIIFFTVMLIGGPLNEEPGWRGFALPRLLSKFSPLTASIILGLIWSMWHGPLHFNGLYGNGLSGYLLRFLYNTPVSIFFTWICLKTEGNLLMAVFLHTSINTDGLFVPMTGISGLVTIIIVFAILIIIVIKNRMWKRGTDKLEAQSEEVSV